MNNRRQYVEVIFGVTDDVIGMLHYQNGRSGGVFSFEYDKNWLNSKHVFALDPSLDLYIGSQYPSNTAGVFGIFTDSSPDRWGRVLMERRETAKAKEEKRTVITLNEMDFLLGVDDNYRLGALRFRDVDTGIFLASKIPSVPHTTSLGDLAHAAYEIEKNPDGGSEYIKWLNILMAPGSSLGGARPKASFNENNHPWIAKFPSNQDRYDVGLFEKVLHDLAKNCGINVPESKIEKIGETGYHTFMCERFDRKDGGRLMYMSAMTAIGKIDGEGGSYLDIADWLSNNGNGKFIEEDLKQLWHRIVFNIMTGNTDDHMRNHGFLMTDKSWRVSPAFDMNPNPSRMNHAISISASDNSPELGLAMSVIDLFRINKEDAVSIIEKTFNIVKNWKVVSKNLGASSHDVSLVEPAFHVISVKPDPEELKQYVSSRKKRSGLI